LYFVSDNEQESYLAAIDKNTGEQVWRVERDEQSNWATPFIWENSLRTEIITPGTGRSRAYDLDGQLLYEFGGCSSITIATPYTAQGLLFVSSGYVGDDKRPIFAIRPGASGDISLNEGELSNEFIAWCQPQAAPYNPSTIVVGEQLYVLHDRGFMTSFDATTGEMVYDKQRIDGGKSFTASPWAYDGKLFCMNEFGGTMVIAAGPEYKLLHTNTLESKELCMATPAIAGQQLFLRTGDAVYCIASDK
jgi:outer membrane protein assembly factor BamB